MSCSAASAELKECQDALVNEQRMSNVDHASNSLYAKYVWMKLVVAYRFYTALSAQEPGASKSAKTLANANLIVPKETTAQRYGRQ